MAAAGHARRRHTLKLNSAYCLPVLMPVVDVTGVEPMTAVVAMKMKMREDVVTDGEIPAAVLANAPAGAGAFFAVPKVVE